MNLLKYLNRGSSGPALDDAATTHATQPLRSVPVEQARHAHKSNPQAIWALRSGQANAADRSLACHRIWSELPELGIRPKFSIAAGEPVFAVGSCFAREVEDALLALGFDVPTHCDALFEAPLLSPGKLEAEGGRARGYLNRYNSMSMRDEFRHLLGEAPEIDAGLMTYELTKSSSSDLHYSQALPQVNAAQTLERRRLVRAYLGPHLRRCKIFVITLGLAECWFDKSSGRYLNNTPGPRVMEAFGEQLEVHLTSFGQHLAALEGIHALLSKSHGPDFKMVITVSPVPLERTFLDQDVILTNTYSKSMLRTVAQTYAQAHENVDYFPSYELATYAKPQGSWGFDMRHVKPHLVAHIMAHFQRHYIAA